MNITPFGVEMWMNAWENNCDFNLAETCVASLTIGELLQLTGQNATDLSALLPMKMTYGAIQGSDRLRTAIAALYDTQTPDNIMVTHGTIGANMLVHRTLVNPGDRVISIVPTYQQHHSIPESLGADIHLLHLRAENGFLPDLDELAALVTPDTKLIAFTNPNNPTGALMDRAMLSQIADIARSADAWVLADEVYRGTDQHGSGMTTAMCDLYDKAISTAGMSKAYSLAGLRLGWVAGPATLMEPIMIHRDYDTISVGMLDDHFAALALENKDRLLARSQHITRNNLATLTTWVDAEPRVTWVRPQSGTTALLTIDTALPSEEFCIKLLADTGVLFTPGSAMGMEGTVRIGYANSAEILAAGLPRVSQFLADCP
jgi:aspartate/methionine/tyrosine aminotransferase